MARLYALDLLSWDEDHWQQLLPSLPPDRVQKVLTCRRPEDRARSAGAGWLLRYALIREGLSPETPIARTALGKPCLPEHPQVQFSLSHAGHWAVCAVSADPVGVDVELPRCTMDIARRFFSPEELEGLELLPEAERRDRLNRLWTAKEAFVKALGGGLTIPLDSFTVQLSKAEALLEQTRTPLPYRLHEYALDGARLCLCCTDARPTLELVQT